MCHSKSSWDFCSGLILLPVDTQDYDDLQKTLKNSTTSIQRKILDSMELMCNVKINNFFNYSIVKFVDLLLIFMGGFGVFVYQCCFINVGVTYSVCKYGDISPEDT